MWSVGSFLGSFGARWLSGEASVEPIGEAHREALSTYLDLIHTIVPPDQGKISFVELLRDFRKGRVGMILEVGNEYANLLRDDPAMAESCGVALIPAGPAGRRPNLYSPPWAIPAKSKVQEEAWELAKFLSSPRQLLEDGLELGSDRDLVAVGSLQPRFRPAFPRRSPLRRSAEPGDRLRGTAVRNARHRGLRGGRRRRQCGGRRPRQRRRGARPDPRRPDGARPASLARRVGGAHQRRGVPSATATLAPLSLPCPG